MEAHNLVVVPTPLSCGPLRHRRYRALLRAKKSFSICSRSRDSQQRSVEHLRQLFQRRPTGHAPREAIKRLEHGPIRSRMRSVTGSTARLLRRSIAKTFTSSRPSSMTSWMDGRDCRRTQIFGSASRPRGCCACIEVLRG